MAKGPLVTDAVEVLIAAVYQKHPKWKAPVVRNEVDFHLHKDNPKLPPGWPSLSTVQKVLAKVRKPRSPDPQEKPWSIATLGDYPIPPEALPKVLELWKYTLELPPLSPEVVSTLQRLTKPIIEEHHLPETLLEEISEKAERRELTIREAKWAARLSAVKPPEHKIMREGLKMPTEGADWLLSLAVLYARHEELNEKLGHPFDSGELDCFLVGLPTKIGYEVEAKGGPGVKTTVRWKLRNLWEAPEWVENPEWVAAGGSAEDIRGCLRGEGNSWQIIIDAGIDAKGKRKRHIETIHGVEDAARNRLIELVFNPTKEGKP